MQERVYVRSLEWAVTRAFHFLRQRGFDSALALVDELWKLDQVALLAELRLVMLRAEFPLAVIARFDR
jgi:hypothetical protein